MPPSGSRTTPRARRARAGALLAGLCATGAGAPAAVAAATLEVGVTDELGTLLEDAVVSVRAGPASLAPPGTVATIDQVERRFAPDVIAVQAGTSVAFPNSDDVRHHVYSFSKPNDFQIKLYHGEPGETVRFEHAGIVTLGCNIHDGMIGHIAVVDTPLFALSGEDGRAAIGGVPPGDHTLSVWHPDTGAVELALSVPPDTMRIERAVALAVRPAAAQPTNPLQGLFAD